VIERIKEDKLINRDFDNLKVADQGCGKLRHLKIFYKYFNIIYLIDTEFQINKTQRLFGKNNITIREYLSKNKIKGKEINLITAKKFTATKLNLDLIFNICVFDVEIPEVRKSMIESSFNNLRNKGIFLSDQEKRIYINLKSLV